MSLIEVRATKTSWTHNMANDDWAERKRTAFRSFANTLDLSISAWANKAGIGSSAIYNFLSGRSDSLSQRTLEALANAADVDVGEITGTMPSLVYGDLPRIPLVGESWAAHYNPDWRNLTNQILLSLPLPKAYSNQAFAIRVRSDEHAAIYAVDSIVICIPPRQALALGTHVLVGHYIADTLHNGLLVEATFAEVIKLKSKSEHNNRPDVVTVQSRAIKPAIPTPVLEITSPVTAKSGPAPKPGDRRILAVAIFAITPQPGMESLGS